MSAALVLLLAADDPALDPSTGRGPEWGKAAPIALLIILLMGIALFLLIRSMNSQLRKVPSAFMRGESPAAPATTAEVTSADAPTGTTRATPEPVDADPADPGESRRPGRT